MCILSDSQIRDKADELVNIFVEDYKKRHNKPPSNLIRTHYKLHILYELNKEKQFQLERIKNEIKIGKTTWSNWSL